MMRIEFASKKMNKTCSSAKLMRKEWGEQLAKKLQLRITQFESFDNLADVSTLPGIRCHELGGDRKGQIAVDLVHPYRLIFRPNHSPVPSKADGGLDWKQVTSIALIEVVDYH